MNSWDACAMRGCLTLIEAWRLRGRTLQAMLLLCVARLLIQFLPFHWWRATLGSAAPCASEAPDSSIVAGPAIGPAGSGRRLAIHAERAAARLPFATKCLPRAMTLGWLLRRAGIAYALKFAARPTVMRQATAVGQETLAAHDETLHAWVEVGGITVIGALPGPWLVVLTLRG